MADTIRNELGLDSELIEDRGGVFDVRVNGELIYSKHAQGNLFPEEQQILRSINEFGSKSG